MTKLPPKVAPGGSWHRVLVIVALVVAAIAFVVSIATWLRSTTYSGLSSPAASPQYREQDAEQSKRAMCDAYQKTTDALGEASGTTSEDPTAKYMIAINIRLAIQANANYLREALSANPAISPELAETFREMASAYDEILMAQLAGAPRESFDSINAELDKTDAEATEACK